MRVGAISTMNAYSNLKTRKILKRNELPQETNSEVNFKGFRGAGIGAGLGAAYVATVCIISGPLMPLTAGILALGAGTGALAGHCIQEEGKDKDD